MAKFAKVFKSLRTQHKLTQQELATKLGVSRSAIGMYENGEREPDFETLEAIADFFNVDMDYLIGRSSCVTTIAAHHDSENWTAEELDESKLSKNLYCPKEANKTEVIS